MPKCEFALGVMEQRLSKRNYFVGDKATLAAIALVAYTRFAPEAGVDIERWPAVKNWVRHIEAEVCGLEGPTQAVWLS